MLIDPRMVGLGTHMIHGDEGEVIVAPGTYSMDVEHIYTPDGAVQTLPGTDLSRSA